MLEGTSLPILEIEKRKKQENSTDPSKGGFTLSKNEPSEPERCC